MNLIRPLPAGTVVHDVLASLVVFLVALPLCIGVALASGVPPELGIVSGIVGGLVTGLLPGSGLHVTGPAAGLTAIVYGAVTDHGVAVLGPLALGAGLCQVGFGVLRLGRWFRVISLSVVQGMLAGIGVILAVGQLYPMLGGRAEGHTAKDLLGLPRLVTGVGEPAELAGLGIGATALAVLLLWPKVPTLPRYVPGALVAVVAAVGVGLLLPATARLRVGTVAAAIRPPDLAVWRGLLGPEVIGLVLAFAFVASATTLFSAAAVDRMHHGRPTAYDRELVAQGAGNAVCGLLGTLPVTAVIVRSAANVQAGARTKLSRVLHGVWLLLFVLAVPALLELIPVAALAAVLLHSGARLARPAVLVGLWRQDRGEAVVAAVTCTAIVTTDLLVGLLVGIGAAVCKCAWQVSAVSTEETTADGVLHLRLTGTATFLRLPRIVAVLDRVPAAHPVRLDLRGLRHLDHACRTAVDHWVARHRAADGRVELLLPAD
ncbi:MAG TPA: SulP family inorganic anion transporter [Actinocatenispora sp.]